MLANDFVRSTRNRVAFVAAGTALAVGTVAFGHSPTGSSVASTDLAGVMAAVASQSALATGSENLFLKIDGIPGESVVKGHEKQIQITDFSWGVENSGTLATKAGTSRATFTDFSFSKYVDSASPLLMLRTASGQHIPTVTLMALKTTGSATPEVYLTITLSDVLVSSYQTGGAEDGSTHDSVAVKFSKITFDYKPQDAKTGKLGTEVHGGWDIKANKPA